MQNVPQRGRFLNEEGSSMDEVHLSYREGSSMKEVSPWMRFLYG